MSLDSSSNRLRMVPYRGENSELATDYKGDIVGAENARPVELVKRNEKTIVKWLSRFFCYIDVTTQATPSD